MLPGRRGQYTRSGASALKSEHPKHSAAIISTSPASSLVPAAEHKGNDESYPSHKHDTTSARWLPYTLRGYLVWIPAVVSFLLALAIMLLYWQSTKHNGIASASSAIVGWRFIPTLLAVVYTQLTTMLFEDVKRTEPFALLAHRDNHTPNASRTILETPRYLWQTLARGFNKKRNGGRRSWSVILACLVHILAFMLISPLSSALLNVEELAIARPMELSRLIPKKDSSIKAVDERDTYFRAMGALLQDVITSPWISDNYTVLPFLPSEASSLPWDSWNLNVSQTWVANTTVFQNNLKCSKLTIASKKIDNMTDTTRASVADIRATLNLETSKGCQIKLSADASSDLTDINLWSNKEYFSENSLLNRFKSGSFDKCDGDEVMLLSSAWLEENNSTSTVMPKFLSNMTATSYSCFSEHRMAMIPVTASISDGVLKVDFDKEQFIEAQQSMTDSMLDIPGFQQLYTNPKWIQYVMAPDGFLGLGSILGTLYDDFDSTKMRGNDTLLLQNAMRIRGRHFGELLRTSLEQNDGSEVEKVRGEKILMERRITIHFLVAVVTAALLFLSFVMLAFITWISRIQRRPLNLTHDPATVLGCVALVASNPQVLESLRNLDQSTQKDLETELKFRQYHTTPGQLHEIGGHDHPTIITTDISSNKPVDTSKHVPFMFKLRTLTSMLVYLVALLVTIVVLHQYASDNFFHHSLFTYRVRYGDTGIFAPFSIIPTLFGVILGLSWNSLDRCFRALQPYFAMSSKSPTKIADGAANNYTSSYWLWTSVKAAKHKHWLLSLVTFGTFATQALIIALSALFQQDVGYISDVINLDRTLELRQTPHIRQVNTYYPPRFNTSYVELDRPYVGDIIEGLFTNLTTNWMYTAEIQLTMKGPEPSWSKDGWSFVPVDLTQLGDAKAAENNARLGQNLGNAQPSAINVTLTTPAIRARAECTRNDEIDDLNTWGTISGKKVTRGAAPPGLNLPTHNSTGHTLLSNLMFPSSVNYTPLTPDGRYITCCTNQTEPSRVEDYTASITVGYWTSYFRNISQHIDSPTGTNGNFSVKWIHGQGGSPWSPMRQAIEFSKVPRVQALSCMPIVERSDAEITVDRVTGNVQSYRLVSAVAPDDSAWSESFVIRNLTDPNDPQSRKQMAQSKDKGDRIVTQNATSSYGVLFLNSLLRASRKDSWQVNSFEGYRVGAYEQVNDNLFNIRNNQTGLNMDFMSYASYMQAGQDANALHNADTLIEHTQRTFTTFFQHYVSSSVSTSEGGWVYQPIGTKLRDIGEPAPGNFPQVAPSGKAAVPLSKLPASNTPRQTSATVTRRVEVLHMSRTAYYVCIAILAWLSATALAVMALQRWEFSNLKRDVECVADVLVLVAGSERLLALVRERGVDSLKGEDIKTRLGWFSDADGRMRWGIEVVENGEVLMN